MTPDAWTAIGTIALAAMTLAAVVTTIGITVQDRRRVDDERRSAAEQEQLAEAWAVVSDMSQTVYFVTGKEENTRLLWLTVANVGRFTITRLEARFCLDGSVLTVPAESERDTPPLWRGETMMMGLVRQEGAMAGILRAGGEGMRYQSEIIAVSRLKDPYALVRWTDRWGNRWQHRLGEVRRIGNDEEWTP